MGKKKRAKRIASEKRRSFAPRLGRKKRGPPGGTKRKGGTKDHRCSTT